MSRDRRPTHIGDVRSVSGGAVSVRIRAGVPALSLVNGQSYRIGQVGSFVRIPLGYTNLLAVCVQVGAAAAPPSDPSPDEQDGRWMTVALFGETIGGEFSRGVGMHPTFGDEVHLLTDNEVREIYHGQRIGTPLEFGEIAASPGTVARLDLARLVSRHSAIVGSTGAGKSNLVAVLLEAIAAQGYGSARVIVIDPHGEYAGAVSGIGRVFSTVPSGGSGPLHVPYWALPFDELLKATLGELNSTNEAAIRAEVESLRVKAAKHLSDPPPSEGVTADSPVPFNLKRLWATLADFENRTYEDSGKHTLTPVIPGDPEKLIANTYPAAAIGSGSPFLGPRRGITRHLELLRNRLMDSRYDFLFEPGEFTPDRKGRVRADLDGLVADWIGHEEPVTVVDLSGTPADVLGLVTGTLLRIIYDTLYWAGDRAPGARFQPLLIVIEEAHLFLPDGEDTAARRIVTKIAREGRKYGIGLMLVTQRPADLDGTVLSQCGTMFALRSTNTADRGKIAATVPDELSNLTGLLPSLRTGEVIVTGEAVPLPSRVRLPRSTTKVLGGDPDVGAGWTRDARPPRATYRAAVGNWRALRMRHGPGPDPDPKQKPD